MGAPEGGSWSARRGVSQGRLRGSGVAGGCQRSRGLTMVKPESLLWPLLSSSGLELGLLDEAEAGPVSGSENTSTGRAAPRSGRSGWAWPAGLGPAPRSSPSLETRTKSSVPGRSRRPGAAGGACKGVRAGGGAVRGLWAGPGSSRGLAGTGLLPRVGGSFEGSGSAPFPRPQGLASGLAPSCALSPRTLGALGASTHTWTGKGLCQRAPSEKGPQRALCWKSTLKAEGAPFENAVLLL